MDKPQETTGGGQASDTAPPIFPDAPQTDAEKKLANDLERAKGELLDQIKSYKPEDELVEQVMGAGADEIEEDPRLLKFSVTDPVKVNNIVKYTIQGEDNEGSFRCQRRFKEFYALSTMLRTRWPGCFIPGVPDKKLMGANDSEYVEERRQLLENFLRDSAKYDYILNSREFKIFSRGPGEIDNVLKSLQRQTPLQVLEKYRKAFTIQEEELTTEKMREYSEQIGRFMVFLQKVIPAVTEQKRQMKKIAATRDQHDKGQREIMAQLMKYEDVGIAFYGNDDYSQRVYTHPNNQDLKKKFEMTERKIRNPYREAYIWIKGELLNLQGMLECLKGRELVMEHQLNLEKKIVEQQTKVNTLKQGKTTMFNFYKSKATKESEAVQLQS